MNDVADEAGLSEDAVAVHFESRDDLVQAIAENIALSVSEFFEDFLDGGPVPPLGEVVERFTDWVVEFVGPDGPGRLAPVFWASALYNETMAGRARVPIERSRSGWIEIAERARAAGNLSAGTDPRAVGTVLACLLPGILLQRQLLEPIDAETVRQGIRALGAEIPAPR
jgi:AcrR family transcriptional regulator